MHEIQVPSLLQRPREHRVPLKVQGGERGMAVSQQSTLRRIDAAVLPVVNDVRACVLVCVLVDLQKTWKPLM